MREKEWNDLINGIETSTEKLRKAARIEMNGGWDFDTLAGIKDMQEIKREKGPKSTLVFRAAPKAIYEDGFISTERFQELRHKERQLEEIKALVIDISKAPRKIDRLKLTLELFALCGVINE